MYQSDQNRDSEPDRKRDREGVESIRMSQFYHLVYVVSYLVSLLQFNGFEVLEFPQIPQLNNRVVSSCGQVVSAVGYVDPVNQVFGQTFNLPILRKGDACDEA